MSTVDMGALLVVAALVLVAILYGRRSRASSVSGPTSERIDSVRSGGGGEGGDEDTHI